MIDHLARTLSRSDDIRAAWLGGSDAFHRADDLSDIDVFILVRRGRVEQAAADFQRCVEQVSPISRLLRLPMPTWHGFHQAFYQLANAPEHLMVDWLAVEQGDAHPWSDVERHGTPVVFFDKDGDCSPRHVDPAAVRRAVAKRVGELRMRFPMFRHLATKQAARGLPADGAGFYHTQVVRPLVDLLRCVHCPDRHDFGMRYLRDDLPAAEYEAVCRLCYPREVGDLVALTREASLMFERALALWDARASPDVAGPS